jgi:hypothetical protein
VCVSFRVDFHPAELAGGAFAWGRGRAAGELTVPVTSAIVRMCGTDASPPRCVALTGSIGQEVGCTIYDGQAFALP